MTTEELLLQAEAEMETQAELRGNVVSPVNDVFIINPETREISVPASEELFGVYQDESVERKYFKCQKIVGDNVDLSTCNIFINYISSEGKPGQYLCDDVQVVEDNITFSWKLTGNVFDKNKDAEIYFAMQAKKTLEDGRKRNVFNTKKAKGKHYETIESGEYITEEYADVILQIITRLDTVENNSGTVSQEQIRKAVNAYLQEHPVLSVEIDDTLTKSGQAADARIVGDRLGDLKETLEEHLTNHPGSGGDAGHSHTNKEIIDKIKQTDLDKWNKSQENVIEKIKVNDVEQEITDKCVNIQIPESNGGNDIVIDSEMSDTSENPVQNKVIKAYIDKCIGDSWLRGY